MTFDIPDWTRVKRIGTGMRRRRRSKKMLSPSLRSSGAGHIDPIDPTETFLSGDVGGFYLFSPSKMFQDSVGGTPVANDGDPVGAIADDSGLGNALTGLTKPVYRTLTLDKVTYHGLEFDGVAGQSLYSGTMILDTKSGGTCFVGIEPAEFTGTNRTAVGMNLHLTGGWGFVIPSTNNSGYGNYRGASNRTVRLDTQSSKYESPYTATLGMRFDFANPHISIYDGTSFVGQSLNDPAGTLVNNPLTVGTRNSTVWPYKGIIWGGIYFNARVLSGPEFEGVMAYMRALVPPNVTQSQQSSEPSYDQFGPFFHANSGTEYWLRYPEGAAAQALQWEIGFNIDNDVEPDIWANLIGFLGSQGNGLRRSILIRARQNGYPE